MTNKTLSFIAASEEEAKEYFLAFEKDQGLKFDPSESWKLWKELYDEVKGHIGYMYHTLSWLGGKFEKQEIPKTTDAIRALLGSQEMLRQAGDVCILFFFISHIYIFFLILVENNI